MTHNVPIKVPARHHSAYAVTRQDSVHL
jgi:hypothetical protein